LGFEKFCAEIKFARRTKFKIKLKNKKEGGNSYGYRD
jgi:hypothetical protein